MKKIFVFLKKHWIEIFFGVIVVVSIFLRFYKLSERMWWDGDMAEDVTIAYHISNFKETIQNGRSNVGGKQLIANSYFYFYLLATVYFLGNSALSVGMFFALNSVLLVVFVYFLAKYFVDVKYALILAAMIAFNSYFIFLSSVSCYNLINLMVVVLIWIFLKSWQERNIKYFWVYLVVLMMTLHGNYSILTIFPVFIFWSILGYFRLTNGRGKKIKLITIMLPIFLLGIWLIVTFQGGDFFDQFRIVNLVTKSNLGIRELGNNWIQILVTSAGFLLKIKNLWLIVIFYFTIYFGLVYLVIYDYRKKNIYFHKSFLLLSLVAGVFGAGWLGGEVVVNSFYVVFYYSLWFLSLVYVWWRFSLFKKFFMYGFALIIFIYFVFGMNISDGRLKLMSIEKGSGGLKESEMISNLILADSEINLISNFMIVFYDKYTQLDNFGASIFWYPIEKKTGIPRVRIIEYPYGEYLKEIKSSRETYLVCYDYESSGKWIRYVDCEKLFLEKHSEKKYTVKKIVEGKEGDRLYKVFRFNES